MMDEANQHTHKPVLIGEILKNGQFKIDLAIQGTGEAGTLE